MLRDIDEHSFISTWRRRWTRTVTIKTMYNPNDAIKPQLNTTKSVYFYYMPAAGVNF